MDDINFDAEKAQKIIDRLNEIKSSLDKEIVTINGSLHGELGAEVNKIIQMDDGTKLREFNQKKQIISDKIYKIVWAINESSKKFANVELDIIQGAKRTEGEIQ